MMDLFPYQQIGAQWLAKMPQALLADEMGLGKSAQAVAACDLIDAQEILIVCPANLRVNWSREFLRFSKYERPCTVVMNGTEPFGAGGINVISYDLLVSSETHQREAKRRVWDVLVLDEAHFLKERSARRTKVIYGHGKWPGVAATASNVWRLTGTPIPNNASELYTHLKSAGVEQRNYWDFVYEFCDGYTSDYGYKIRGVRNVPKLKHMLSQIMLRRKKEDVLKELPDITVGEVTVPRNKVELDPYFLENWYGIGIPKFMANLEEQDKTLKASLMAIRDGHHFNADDALKLLESYAKSTATLRRYIGMAKLTACLDIIEDELANGAVDKIVLFAVHKDVIELARQRLRKFHPVTLFGGTPNHKRQHHVDRFQNDKSCRVFIGQVQAAGVGITLTASKEVAFLEASWVPADNAQAAMRCHRVGQTRRVRVRFFTCAGSVDEQVMRVVVQKTRDITKVLD